MSILDPWGIAGSASATVVAVVAWIGKRHLDDDRAGFSAVSARLAALESDRVVKPDLVRVEERLERLSNQVHEGQREILERLIDLKG